MAIVPLIGNPQPGSRTRLVAEEVADQLARRSGAEVAATIELADHAGSLFTFPDEGIDGLLERVRAAEVLVVASPTYKASYTGLLKAFLDRYGTNGLTGVTAVPIFTIGAPAHALAVEFTLRPLLVELGASAPTRPFAVTEAKLGDLDALAAAWADEAAPVVAALLSARGAGEDA